MLALIRSCTTGMSILELAAEKQEDRKILMWGQDANRMNGSQGPMIRKSLDADCVVYFLLMDLASSMAVFIDAAKPEYISFSLTYPKKLFMNK